MYHYYSTTTTTTTLPTYLHSGYQSYCAALYAIRAGWPGRCCQNRVPCAGTLKLDQTTNNVGPLRRWHVIADMPEPLLARPAPVSDRVAEAVAGASANSQALPVRC